MTTFFSALAAFGFAQLAMFFHGRIEIQKYEDGKIYPIDKALPIALMGAALGLAFYAGVAQ